MWLLRACCRHVHFACRLPAAGRALRRARSDLRANSSSPSKHVNPAHLFLPVACVEQSSAQTIFVFWRQARLACRGSLSFRDRSARRSECRELLWPSTDFVAHYEITCLRRVLSNTENVASQIGNFFPNRREVFPKLDATLSHISDRYTVSLRSSVDPRTPPDIDGLIRQIASPKALAQATEDRSRSGKNNPAAVAKGKPERSK